MNSLLRNSMKYTVPVLFIIVLALLAAFVEPETINNSLGGLVGILAGVLFESFPGLLSALWGFLTKLPLVILVLVSGAVYFTFRFNFINILGFWHAIQVTRGIYDNPDDPGEVSHFQALSSALSATVGLGNIAGVAVAVTIGGPGAIFWMMCTAFFGMTSKFAECTLGQMYRKTDPKGQVQGGPMVYLRDGIAELGYPTLGKYLAVTFAVLCIGGSFGGGNMFQANQSYTAMAEIMPWLGGKPATGEVVLSSTTRTALKAKKRNVQFLRPKKIETIEYKKPITNKLVTEEKVTKALLTYRPAKNLNIVPTDWKPGKDGLYHVTVKVESAKNDPSHDIKALEIASMQIRDPKAAKPAFVAASFKVSNPDTISGAISKTGRSLTFGILLAAMVGVVIIGGIKSIGSVAEKVVPLMCGIYLLAALYVILVNVSLLDDALWIIWDEAWNPAAGVGGVIGAFIQGVKRAAFSSEAGVGSAAIAHSAARTDEPIREGIVALLEPFIDTIVVCFMTGMVIVITGVYANPETMGLNGVELTSAAFGQTISWFPYVLSLAVFLFAYSTMISWSYYGERCWTFLFGADQSTAYRIIFLVFVVVGCVSSLQNVIDFSDLMILAMALPNVIGVVMLSGKINEALVSYWTRYKNGEFKTYD